MQEKSENGLQVNPRWVTNENQTKNHNVYSPWSSKPHNSSFFSTLALGNHHFLFSFDFSCNFPIFFLLWVFWFWNFKRTLNNWNNLVRTILAQIKASNSTLQKLRKLIENLNRLKTKGNLNYFKENVLH